MEGDPAADCRGNLEREYPQAGDHWRAISGTRSQTEFERKPLQEVQRCVNVLIALEKRLAIDRPATDQDLRACCAMAAEDVDHPGKNTSFAEALTAGKPNGWDDSQSVPF